MKNIFLLSDYFKPISTQIRFYLLVFLKAITIIFRHNKKIKKQFLNYSTKHIFTNSYLIIEFDFNNSLYYKIDSIVKTLEKKPIILNISKYHKKEIVFEVVGLFQKRSFLIPINVSQHFQTLKIQASFAKPKLTKTTQPLLKEKSIVLRSKEKEINKKEIILKKHCISITNTLYNQNDFL